MNFSSDRAARDNLVDDLKAKIRHEKKILENHAAFDSGEAPVKASRPHRARKLSEVFKSMGF